MAVHNAVGVVGKDPTTGAAIPLVTTTDHRVGLAAFLRRITGTARAKTGKIKGGRSANLNVGGTSGWAYTVQPGALVVGLTDTGGAYVIVNDGSVTLATDPAPGSGSRTDIIYMGQADAFDSTATVTQALLGVARGPAAATGTPIDPAIPVGAVEIGRNRMTSAATTTSSTGNTISSLADFTTAAGGVNYYGTAAAMAADTSRDAGDIAYVSSAQRAYLRRGVNTDSQLVLVEDIPAPPTVQARSGSSYAAGGLLIDGGKYRTVGTVSVTVPAGTTGILRAWFGIYAGLVSGGNYSGSLYVIVDGTTIRSVPYGNHGRAGYSQFNINEPGYKLAAGAHTITIALDTDAGETQFEMWDGRYSVSAEW